MGTMKDEEVNLGDQTGNQYDKKPDLERTFSASTISVASVGREHLYDTLAPHELYEVCCGSLNLINHLISRC